MLSATEILHAKDEICEVLARYCRALDRHDFDLAASCWHEGSATQHADHPLAPSSEEVSSGAAIRRSSMITNVVVDVNGINATSEAYGMVWLQLEISSDSTVLRHWRGRYLDRLSNRNGRWAIDKRQIVTDCYSETDIGTAGLPAGMTSLSRQDKTDPSYAVFASMRG